MGGGIASRPCTPGIAAVIILAAFSVSVPGIGVSQLAWELFLAAAAFEFVRQFMRWSHAGYMSEHMPSDLPATAIGMTLMCRYHLRLDCADRVESGRQRL